MRSNSFEQPLFSVEGIRSSLREVMPNDIPEDATAQEIIEVFDRLVEADPDNAQHLSKNEENFIRKEAAEGR